MFPTRRLLDGPYLIAVVCVVLQLMIVFPLVSEAQVPRDALQQARASVFLVGVVNADDGRFDSVGTVWAIDRRYLASNAHVAEALMERKGPRDRIVAKRGVFDRNEIVLGEPLIHPAYPIWNPRIRRLVRNDDVEMELFDYQPVADVAVLPVMVGAPEPLRVATGADYQPLPGRDVVFYMGYPMEGVSGFATLHTIPMHVSAITDYFFQDADWRDGGLMHLAGQASGGASGSPIIRADDGAVVGILSSGDFVLGWTGRGSRDLYSNWRRVNIGFSYAQNVELALELVNGTAHERQRERNLQWQSVLRTGIFARSDDVIRSTVERGARVRYRVQPDQIERVTHQRWRFRADSSTRSLPITLERGFAYWFVAHSDDGTWINGRVTADGRTLGLDDMHDNLPLIDVISRSEGIASVFEVEAIEEIFGYSEVEVHVYRHEVDLGAETFWEQLTGWLDAAEEEGQRIHHEILTMHRHGRWVHTFKLEHEAGSRYFAYARSRRGRDIDLVARHGEEEIASDRLLDHYPVIEYVAPSADIEIDLIIPSESRLGEEVEFTLWRIPRVIFSDGSSAAVNPEGQPHFGTVTLSAGFVPDPHTVRVRSGGAVDARTIDQALIGFIASSPDVVLNWSGSPAQLRIFFEADSEDGDTTLVIRTPDGRWIGNDDAFAGTLDPMLDLAGYGEGRYAIWVGSFNRDEDVLGTLTITETGGVPGGTRSPSTASTPAVSPPPGASAAAFEALDLRAGFTPDPRTVTVVSGGARDARAIDAGLRGFIADAPDVVLNWSGSTDALRVFFEADDSNGDTTLVIQTPSGRWIGNDDAFAGTLNPMLELSGHGEGRYNIWVGSFRRNENFNGQLTITEYRHLRPR